MGLKKCCWDDCKEPRKQKKSFSGKDPEESTYRYCDYHYPIMKRFGRYNVDKYTMEKMLQSTSCDLCSRDFDRNKRGSGVVIDHCHETGKVRGAICSACNVGLGLLGDTEKSIIKALNYLKYGNN
tara:strand:+ start:118 stop:492 length:375 start_codon:yes stop_codon:yes gene_type:complete